MNDQLRIPPHSIESERGIIGSILLDPAGSVDTCIEKSVVPDSFYDRRHQHIFESIMSMHSNGKPIDGITIGEYISERDLLDAVGGYEYLINLQSDALVAAHCEHYCDVVLEKAEYRRLIEKSLDVLDKCYSAEEPAETIGDNLIAGVMSERTIMESASVDSIVASWESAMRGEKIGIPTPFEALDKCTGPIRYGMNTVFCGRSGGGKSMLLAAWYNHLGQNGYPILALPFEDLKDVTIRRMAANAGRYDYGVVDNGGSYKSINGTLEWVPSTQKQIDYAVKYLKEVSLYPVYFWDKRITPQEFRGVAVRYKRKYGIKAAFIDGVKDFKRSAGQYSDVGFDEECSQSVCMTAEELDIATVCIHHLTKIPDDELISSINIRGSGNIVSDARRVYALQSKALEKAGANVRTDEEGRVTTRIFDCIKNNHGEMGQKVLETDLGRVQFFDGY